MASTWSSADPRFDGEGAPLDPFIDIEQGLAMLVHASYPPDAPASAWDPASDGSADARTSRSSGTGAGRLDAGTLGAADLRPPIPRKPRSRRRRGGLVRIAIVVCLGACAIWAWRSWGGSAEPAEPETSAPAPARAASQATSHAGSHAALIGQPAETAANDWGPAAAERKQLESDLAALRQTVGQLAAGQDQLTREIARLRAAKPQPEPKAEKPKAEQLAARTPDKRTVRRVAAHPARPRAAPARKLARTTPMRPQAAARQIATATAYSSPPRPQIQSQTQSVDPVRPPMPVP